MLYATLHSALPETTDVGPLWVHLMPAGTFTGVDGRGPFHLRDPQAVILASMKGTNARLPVDENHATDLAGPQGNPSPARGWIVQMQSRQDGLWGLVEWTATGQQMMAEKAYRGVSPVFTHAKDGTVIAVLRMALTNTPNLAELAFLHHQQDPSMDLSALRKALGLADTADEAAILAAVQANATKVAGHSAQLTAIATAAGVPTTDVTTLMTALQTQREASGGVAQMTQQIVALQTQLSALQAESRRTAAIAFVDGQIRAGKPINAVRDHYITRHMADAAAVETELTALPSINAGGVVLNAGKSPEQMSDEDMMSAADREVCQKMGLDPKKFAENKRKMQAADKAAGRDGTMA